MKLLLKIISMLNDFKIAWSTIWYLISKPMSRWIYWLYLLFIIIWIWWSQIVDSVSVYYWNQSVFSWSTELSQNLFNFYITIFISSFFVIKQKIKNSWWSSDEDYWENIIYLFIGFFVLLSLFLIFKFSLPSWLWWILYVLSLVCWTISVSDDDFINKRLSNIKHNSTTKFQNRT